MSARKLSFDETPKYDDYKELLRGLQQTTLSSAKSSTATKFATTSISRVHYIKWLYYHYLLNDKIRVLYIIRYDSR